MVNVVAGRALVPELLQHRATPSRVAAALIELLRDEPRREAMKRELRAVRATLGPPGAVDRAASAVLDLLRT